MNILIRADSSSTIGTGHIMRDLVLAKQFPNNNIIFAVQELDGNINSTIIENSFEIKYLKSNKFNELNNLIKTLKIDMIIIDHYKINAKFEKKLKQQNPTIKLMVLDDTYEKHHCDILLNHNISADPKKYKNKVPKYCELRCGSKYILLRDEFYKVKRKNKKKKSKKKTIFLAMGGADTAQLNIPILKELQNFSNIQVELITTTANKKLNKLQKYSKKRKWIHLHINSKNMAKLMVKSDFAIVTPSVTVNEVYFMKLPFIAIKTASNQEDIYSYLKKKKYLTLSSFKSKKLKEMIKELL